MMRSNPLDRLAQSSAALVQDYDLTGMLVRVLAEATETVEADAGGLLVENRHGRLELLSATSHRAAELETYQAFSGEGPCLECMRRQAPAGFGVDEAADLWPEVARLMESSGYSHVLATPLRWRGVPLGGLNLFWSHPPEDEAAAATVAQAFSDMLTLFIVNADPVSPSVLRERLEGALEGRAVIEQAKGVLSEREGLDMDDAYRRLLELHERSGEPLSDVARSVIRAANRHPRSAD